MYCKNCGKEIDDKAYICLHCGVLTGVNNDLVSNKEIDKTPYDDVVTARFTLIFILTTFFSYVGLINAYIIINWNPNYSLKGRKQLPFKYFKSRNKAIIIIEGTIMFLLNFIYLLLLINYVIEHQ